MDKKYSKKQFALQFITHTHPEKSHAQLTEAVCRGGCRWVQLRMKNAKESAIIKNAKEVKAICDDYDAIFIIDDHVQIAKEVGASGVHLGKSDMCPAEARKILGKDYIIGGTANTLEDVDELVSKGVDYVGLGPFRFTTTKEKLSPVLGLQGYKDIIDNLKSPIDIVAIGGIKDEDCFAILQNGAAGVAISGAIINAKDSIEATKKFIYEIG